MSSIGYELRMKLISWKGCEADGVTCREYGCSI
jgi:hypothetical protein